jgi:hypothetical protein
MSTAKSRRKIEHAEAGRLISKAEAMPGAMETRAARAPEVWPAEMDEA